MLSILIETVFALVMAPFLVVGLAIGAVMHGAEFGYWAVEKAFQKVVRK